MSKSMSPVTASANSSGRAARAEGGHPPTVFSVASSPAVVKLALRMSLLVGTLLNVINQGGALFGDRELDVFKLVLTYCVPYCVATYSATSITLRGRR